MFFDNAYTFGEFFLTLQVSTPDLQEVKFNTDRDKLLFKNLTTLAYKHHDLLCYHIDFSRYLNGTQFTYLRNRQNVMIPVFGVIVDIKFANVSEDNLYMFLTTPGTLPDSTKFISVGFKRQALMYVDYKRTELNLLKAPFTTNCRDYAVDGFASRSDCLYRCTVKEALERKMPLPDFIPYSKKDDIEFQASDERLEVYSDDCLAQCQKVECRIVRFYGRLVKTYAIDPPVRIWYLHLPSEPDLVVKYKPAIVFDEYLAMMASIVNLWLGLSVCSLFDIVIRLANISST